MTVDTEYVAYLTQWTASNDITKARQARALLGRMLLPDLEKVGPKGYEHGWIFVGIPVAGTIVHHPEHGRGTVARAGKATSTVHFDSGHKAAFEHGGVGEGHFVARAPTREKKPKPATSIPPQPSDTIRRIRQGDRIRYEIGSTGSFANVGSLPPFTSAPDSLRGAHEIFDLRVPPEARGQGDARRIMDQITEDADRDRRTLILRATADDARDQERLEAFYASYGFNQLVAGPGEYWVRAPLPTKVAPVEQQVQEYVRAALRRLGGDTPDTSPPPFSMGRTRTRAGSVASLRLPSRPVRLDDTIHDPNNERRSGRVLNIDHRDGTMLVAWSDGHKEWRPISSVVEPTLEHRRHYMGAQGPASRRMDEALGGPAKPRTGRQRLADEVAAGRVDSTVARRLLSGESPTAIVDSRTPAGFRDREMAKLPRADRAALQGMPPEAQELYWIRRAAGQGHKKAIGGLGGELDPKRLGKQVAATAWLLLTKDGLWLSRG
jgi:GNAT superfamily N-acetyltransferase